MFPKLFVPRTMGDTPRSISVGYLRHHEVKTKICARWCQPVLLDQFKRLVQRLQPWLKAQDARKADRETRTSSCKYVPVVDALEDSVMLQCNLARSQCACTNAACSTWWKVELSKLALPHQTFPGLSLLPRAACCPHCSSRDLSSMPSSSRLNESVHALVNAIILYYSIPIVTASGTNVKAKKVKEGRHV